MKKKGRHLGTAFLSLMLAVSMIVPSGSLGVMAASQDETRSEASDYSDDGASLLTPGDLIQKKTESSEGTTEEEAEETNTPSSDITEITGWKNEPVTVEVSESKGLLDESNLSLLPGKLRASTKKGVVEVPVKGWHYDMDSAKSSEVSAEPVLDEHYTLMAGLANFSAIIRLQRARQMIPSRIRRAPAAGKAYFETGAQFQQDIRSIVDPAAVKSVVFTSIANKPGAGVADVGARHYHTSPDGKTSPSNADNATFQKSGGCYTRVARTVEEHGKHSGLVRAAGCVCDACGASYWDLNGHDGETWEWGECPKKTYTINFYGTACGYVNGAHQSHVYAWVNNGTLYFASEGDQQIYFNADSKDMFSGFTSLESLDISQCNAAEIQDNTNFVSGCKTLKSITLGNTWRFTNPKASGLASINEWWHKEDPGNGQVETNLGVIDTAVLAGYTKEQAVSMGIDESVWQQARGAGVDYRSEGADASGHTVGFESMFNNDPGSYAGTWLAGPSIQHYYWKIEGVANLNNMYEIHHADEKFTTYCWAQHRGPNSGRYDRLEVKTEAQMIANLNVYHQNYRPLPKIDPNDSMKMLKSFITIMYFGDVEKDPLNLQKKYHLSAQEMAYNVTFAAVQYCSDSANWGYSTNASAAFKELLSKSYSDIPAERLNDLHFYVYLSAHDGGGQQQMGCRSVQQHYYGGVSVRKQDKFGNPLNGAEFTITSEETGASRVIKSGSDGEARICEMEEKEGLKTGWYTLKETKAPAGYELSQDTFRFYVSADRVTETGYRNGNKTKEQMIFHDLGQLDIHYGYVQLHKTSSGNGQDVAGSVYTITAAEDIIADRIDGSGSVTLYHKGDVVLETMTSVGGLTPSEKLPVGKYTIEETKAAGGYLLNTKKEEVTVTENSNSGAPVVVSVKDDPKRGKYTVKAKKVITNGTKIYDGMFTFGLFRLTGKLDPATNEPAYEENPVATAVNDKDGNVTFKEMTYDPEEPHTFQGEEQYVLMEISPVKDRLHDKDFSIDEYKRYGYDLHKEYVFVQVVDDGSDDLKCNVYYSGDKDGSKDYGEFGNTFKQPPVIPDPIKTVSDGKVDSKHVLEALTDVEGKPVYDAVTERHTYNIVEYGGKFHYDVYQTIPAEDRINYFKSFSMYDEYPAGIFPQTVRVLADGTDVTGNFKFTLNVNGQKYDSADGTDFDAVLLKAAEQYNPKEDQDNQYTVLAEYTADLNDPAAYNRTYDLKSGVIEIKEVNEKRTFYNFAATKIVYQDVENHYIFKDGQAVKDEDGNYVYETENPYAKDENSFSGFETKTTTDEKAAEHYRTSNEVKSDIYPSYKDEIPGEKDPQYDTWHVTKTVSNDAGDDINTYAIHDGDTLTYTIKATNETLKIHGKVSIKDDLGGILDKVDFVSADQGGTFDEKTGILSWKDLAFNPSSDTVVSFKVKVKMDGAYSDIDNKAEVTATADNGMPKDPFGDPDGEKVSYTKTTNTVHNYVPRMVKVVTNEQGKNINGTLQKSDSVVTYHLFVQNTDTAGTDPERDGKHFFTITDEIPEGAELMQVAKEGVSTNLTSLPDTGIAELQTASELTDAEKNDGFVSWSEEFAPGEIREYEFTVKLVKKGTMVKNSAVFTTDNEDPKTPVPADKPMDPNDPGTPAKPQYPSNGDTGKDGGKPGVPVVTGVPSDPVKSVRTLDGTDVNEHMLQAGDTYQYVITEGNPTSVPKTITVTDTLPEHTELVDVYDSVLSGSRIDFDGTFGKVTEENPDDPYYVPALPGDGKDDAGIINTHSVEGKNITWTVEIGPGETRDFVFTFKPSEKNVYWTNQAHVKISNNVPVDPVTGKEIPGGEDNVIENDTNIVRNWTPADPVKTVSRVVPDDTLAEQDRGTEQDMNGMLVFGENKDRMTYHIAFANNSDLAKTFVITDRVDDGLTFEKASDGGKYDKDSRKVTWTLKLEGGEKKEIWFNVKVSCGNVNSVIRNFANMVVDEAYPDSETVHTTTDITPVKSVYDKDGKDIDTFLVNKDDSLVYTIRVHNPDTVTKQFVVKDTVPENTEFVSADKAVRESDKEAEAIGEDNEKDLVNTVETDKNGGITWTADLPAGSTYAFTFHVKTLKKGSYVPNEADVYVDKSHIKTNLVKNWTPEDPMKAVTEDGKDVNGKVFFKEDESKVTYQITVKNPADIEKKFTVTDELDKDLKFVSADNGGTASGQTVTWKDIAVPAGESKIVSVTVQFVKEPSKEKIPNKAVVAADNWKQETNTVVNYVTYAPVKKVLDMKDTDMEQGMIFADNEYKYTITFRNPDEKDHVYTVTDTLQDGVTFVSADNNGKADGQKVTWEDLKVEAGKEMTVSMTVKADKALENKKIENTGHVEYSPKDETGDTSKYRHDTNKVTVYISAVEKTVTDKDQKDANNQLKAEGDTLIYHLHVKNPSDKDQEVTVVDDLPEGIVPKKASNGGKISGQTVTFENVKIAAGGADLTVEALVDGSAKEMKNTFKATSHETETTSNEVVNYLLEAPKKAVSANGVDGDGQTVESGSKLTYSVTFRNNAKEKKAFTVTDAVDKTLTIGEISDNGAKSSDNVITWKLTLDADEEKTVTFEATAPEVKSEKKIENTAHVTADNSGVDTNKVTVNIVPKNHEDKVGGFVPTGDTPELIIWLSVFAVAAIALIVLKVKRNKKSGDRKE